MNVTAFIHASIAYPNAAGHQSLARALFRGKPLIVHVLETCLASSHVREVVLVTSDHPLDAVFESDCKSLSLPHGKSIVCFSIPSKEKYSFVPHRSKMRAITFPYLWSLGRGCFSLDGFKALTSAYNAHDVIILEAEQCWGLTTACVDQLSLAIKGHITQYSAQDPLRVGLGAHVSYVNAMSSKYASKIADLAERERTIPFLSYLCLVLGVEEGSEAVSDTKISSGPLMVMRPQEYALIQACTAEKTMEWALLQEAIRFCVEPQAPFYMRIDAQEDTTCFEQGSSACALIERASRGIVLHCIIDSKALALPAFYSFIRCAKEKRVTSVWIEVSGASLDERTVHELSDTGADLILLSANGYEEKPQEMETMCALFETVRQKRQSLTPFIGITYVLSSWLTKEIDAFLRKLETNVDRLVLRSNYGTNHTAGKSALIDFSPLNRIPCRAIPFTQYMNGSGEERICHRDDGKTPCGGYAAGEGTIADKKVAILQEQAEKSYGKTFAPCLQCKEWYVPALHQTFSNCDTSRMEERGNIVQINTVTTKQEALAIETSIAQSLRTLEVSKRAFIDQIRIYEKRLKGENESMAQTLIRRDLRIYEYRTTTISAFERVMKRYWVPLGDCYISLGAYEEGLAAWERVLRYDPTHEYIHRRLDELLRSAQC